MRKLFAGCACVASGTCGTPGTEREQGRRIGDGGQEGGLPVWASAHFERGVHVRRGEPSPMPADTPRPPLAKRRMLLGIFDVAGFVDRHPVTIRRWIKAGLIPM